VVLLGCELDVASLAREARAMTDDAALFFDRQSLLVDPQEREGLKRCIRECKRTRVLHSGRELSRRAGEAFEIGPSQRAIRAMDQPILVLRPKEVPRSGKARDALEKIVKESTHIELGTNCAKQD
jgi:hypothetical protein